MVWPKKDVWQSLYVLHEENNGKETLAKHKSFDRTITSN